MLKLLTLGRLELRVEGETIALRRKELVLIAYLALRGRPVDRELAASLLWGETSERNARNSLRQALWRIRRLAEPVLQADERMLRISANLEVDALQFSADVAAGGWASAQARWKGTFLEGAGHTGTAELQRWIEERRAELERQRGTALDGLMRTAAAQSKWSEAVEWAELRAEQQPLDEASARDLASMRMRAGRGDDALHALDSFAGRAAGSDLPTSDDFQLLRTQTRTQLSSLAAAIPPARGELTVSQAQTMLIEAVVSPDGRPGQVIMLAGDATQRADFMRVLRVSASAQGDEVTLLDARARSVLPGHPYAVVADLLRNLRAARGISAASDQALSEVASLVPALRQRFKTLPQATHHPTALRNSVNAVLRDIAHETRLLIVVDDAQDIDSASADLLQPLIQDPPPQSLVVFLSDPRTGLTQPPLLRLSDSPHARLISLKSDLPGEGAIPARRMRRRLPLAAAVLFAAVIVVAAWRTLFPADSERILAVAPIQMGGLLDSAVSADAVTGLLATQLATIDGVRVISTSRMHELSAQLARRGYVPTSAAIARKARAQTLIEGELDQPDGNFRLQFHQVDLETGRIHASTTITARDLPTVLKKATALFANTYGAVVPVPARNELTRARLVAYRYYEEGLRSYHNNDKPAAHWLFETALARDSTFAMAAFYLGEVSEDSDEAWHMLRLARRLSAHTSDRERLIIQAQYAAKLNEPNQLAIAETLAVRYPAEPDGYYFVARANDAAGRYAQAVPYLEKAITLDSLSFFQTGSACRACDAISGLVGAYTHLDSLAAAEQVARKWIRILPRSFAAWTSLAGVLEFQGRLSAAETAYRQADRLNGEPYFLSGHQFELAIRKGDFRLADSLVQDRLEHEGAPARADNLWRWTLSLRNQGRLREALAAAREIRRISVAANPTDYGLSAAATQGLILLELGRYRAAAALFDSIARLPGDGRSASGNVRHLVTFGALEATARAALGDTARLREIETDLRVQGRQSAYGYVHNRHYYVMGLRRELQGQPGAAAEAFALAALSPTNGFMLANYGRARALIADQRPAEAVTVLSAAVRGALGATGTFVPKTELHHLMARALDQAKAPKEAEAHYRAVLDAWQHSDPQFRTRRDSARARLERPLLRPL